MPGGHQSRSSVLLVAADVVGRAWPPHGILPDAPTVHIVVCLTPAPLSLASGVAASGFPRDRHALQPPQFMCWWLCHDLCDPLRASQHWCCG